MKFYLKKSTRESNTAPAPHLIMLKMYDRQFHDGRFVYSTGERIDPGKWDDEKGEPKKGNEALTKRLLSIRTAANEYLLTNRQTLTKEGLKNHLDALRPKEAAPLKSKAAIERKPETLVELWEEHLSNQEAVMRPQTLQNLTNSKDSFKTWLKTGNWLHLTPEVFDLNYLNKYASHLAKNYKPNTCAKKLKHLKSFFAYLQDDMRRQIPLNLKKIKYKETSGLKISLTWDQLESYERADLSPYLALYRDIAVMQANTGLRISDLMRLDKNIKGDEIILRTKKTNEEVRMPLTPIVRAILSKYNGRIPAFTEQRYREGLKRLHKHLFPEETIQVRDGNEFKSVPVHEEISSHDMVRTFINLSWEAGMPLVAISLITGKSIAILIKNYIKESHQVALKEMTRVWVRPIMKVANG